MAMGLYLQDIWVNQIQVSGCFSSKECSLRINASTNSHDSFPYQSEMC